MNPTIKAALERLTDACNIGLLHPLDKKKIPELIARLHEAEFRLDPDEIKDWLIERGWPRHNASFVEQLDQSIRTMLARPGRELTR